MISIPMLLTRRSWLGRATPYFLSLFVRLASLHALRPQSSSFFQPYPKTTVAFFPRDILFSYFCQHSFRRDLAVSCHFFPPLHIPQVLVCKILLTDSSAPIESLLTRSVYLIEKKYRKLEESCAECAPSVFVFLHFQQICTLFFKKYFYSFLYYFYIFRSDCFNILFLLLLYSSCTQRYLKVLHFF